jgi:hypothetical protein
MRIAFVLLLAAAGPIAQAGAQSARFLVPEQSAAELGGAVHMSIAPGVEAGAAPDPWPADGIAHFFARTAWTQENRDELAPREGSQTLAAWPADRPGVLLLGVDLEPSLEIVGAEPFAAFVHRTLGATARGALGELPGPGEVVLSRTESAKALVVVESGGAEPASIATSKAGQAVEIRPLMDPTAIRPGSDLPVRLYASIPGAKGGLAIATNTTTGRHISAAADDSAIAHLRIDSAGRWRVEFHAVARRDAAPGEVQFEVHTATLTFDVREEVAR